LNLFSFNYLSDEQFFANKFTKHYRTFLTKVYNAIRDALEIIAAIVSTISITTATYL
jgi:hypothetical protein